MLEMGGGITQVPQCLPFEDLSFYSAIVEKEGNICPQADGQPSHIACWPVQLLRIPVCALLGSGLDLHCFHTIGVVSSTNAVT